jgi:hypothetical protein
MVFLISVLSLLTTDIGLSGLTDSMFWINYGITTTIGILSRFILMPKGFEQSRDTDEYKAISSRIKTISSRIIKSAKMSLLNKYIKNYNLQRLINKKVSILEEKVVKKPKKWSDLHTKYNKREDLDDHSLLDGIKAKIKPTTPRQLLSAYNVTNKEAGSLESKTEMVFLQQSMTGLVIMAVVTLLFQSLAIGGSANWEGMYILGLRLFSMIMGLYTGYSAAYKTIQIEELPTLNERLKLLEDFCATADIKTQDIKYKPQG